MLTCFLIGGLGNQLFQIFATISYALKFGHKFQFLDIEILTDGKPTTTVRYTYWKSFLGSLSFALASSIPYDYVLNENGFEFNEDHICSQLLRENNLENVYMLRGYFQSYKYFHLHFQTICRFINLKKIKTDFLQKVNYSNKFFSTAISLHFRIGDYKGLEHVHPIMREAYYKRSLAYIHSLNETCRTVIYFCEDSDVDEASRVIKYLSLSFPEYTFVQAKAIGIELDDWEQMIFMSCCHHNIIANSSFSWWGAYFNEFNDKIVCYPSKWFGPATPHNTKDLCPPSWTKIEA